MVKSLFPIPGGERMEAEWKKWALCRVSDINRENCAVNSKAKKKKKKVKKYSMLDLPVIEFVQVSDLSS